MSIALRHITLAYGRRILLRDVSASVPPGSLTALIGRNGTGKSTLLRCINLLETPTSGEILYRGQNVTGPKVNAPQYRSHVGMVFQSFNLFNNMSVLKNCMVGQMKVLKKSKAEAEENAEEAFEQRRELNALRHKMHKAVEEEDFETAIELRDMIRKMENK